MVMLPPVKRRYRASVVVCHQEKILGVRMRDPASGISRVYLPGGKIETGEDPWQAARRECLEETGYKIVKVRSQKKNLLQEKKESQQVPLTVTAKYLFSWGGIIHDCKTEFFVAQLKDPTLPPTQIVDDETINHGAVWIPFADVHRVFGYHRVIYRIITQMIGVPALIPDKQLLCAFSRFRGTMSADVACSEATSAGSSRGWRCTSQVLADGGRDSLRVWVDSMEQQSRTFRIVDLQSVDPLGRPVSVRVGISDEAVPEVFVESADCLGLHYIDQPTSATALAATSRGLAIVLRDLSRRLPEGSHIVIGFGDSGVSDCGIGMLLELGALVEINASGGRELIDAASFNAALLSSIVSVKPPNVATDPGRDWQRLRKFSWTLLCDVDHSLDRGSDFFAQKGVDAEAAVTLKDGFRKMASLFGAECGGTPISIEHGGASGGVPAALHVFFDADLRSGSDWLLDHVQFEKLIGQTSLVLTGEGATDHQSLGGKASVACIMRSLLRGVPVALISGRLELQKWPAWLKKHLRFKVACGRDPTPEVAFSKSVGIILGKFLCDSDVRDKRIR